jgi:hypothetical protein
MNKELAQTTKLYKSLLHRKEQVFPMPRKGIEAPTKQGVYIIIDSRGSVVHVGKTSRGRGGIKQRLHDHLHGASSFTYEYLGGKGSKLRGEYKYKFIEVANPRIRTLLEAYATALLCPRHLGLGAK